MKNQSDIPLTIGKRETYKNKTTLSGMYSAFMNIPYAIGLLIRNKREKVVAESFIERIMLAVTEVNGCAVCSYAHTQLALNQGLSNEEIYALLSGDSRFIKPSESKAIFFAQHYAESAGVPDKRSYEAIEMEYGSLKAAIILAAIQLISAGNAYGIPQSAFKSRLSGKPYQNSSLSYEIGMQTGGIVVLLLALLHGSIKKMLGMKHQKFC